MKLNWRPEAVHLTLACLSLYILIFLTIDTGGMVLYTCIFADQEEWSGSEKPLASECDFLEFEHTHMHFVGNNHELDRQNQSLSTSFFSEENLIFQKKLQFLIFDSDVTTWQLECILNVLSLSIKPKISLHPFYGWWIKTPHLHMYILISNFKICFW